MRALLSADDVHVFIEVMGRPKEISVPIVSVDEGVISPGGRCRTFKFEAEFDKVLIYIEPREGLSR